MKNLKWKKGVFSGKYSIYGNSSQIGELKDNMFSKKARGQLNSKSFTFRTTGFFQQRTQIYDDSNNEMVGEISYNNWMTKATLTTYDKVTNWKYNNAWNTKWSLSGQDGTKVRYAGASNKGTIESNTDDELLLLSGLYVTNYYWQMTLVILFAVFIPLWSALNN
jgi:hypothetical protein